MSALKGLKKKEANDKITSLLDTVNLTDSAHKKLGGFSGGMKQRALIAQALLNDPKILILDDLLPVLTQRKELEFVTLSVK